MDIISDKTLVMVVGPTAVGKSTVMNMVANTYRDYGYVESFTTRAPRENENGSYRFIALDEAYQLIDSGQTITNFKHPTTGDIYGTTASSYPQDYNLLDTLSTSVDEYRSLPFEQTLTITLTASPSQWLEWFLSRYPSDNPEARKRLAESAQSIKWSLSDQQTSWLVNQAGDIASTASQLVKLVNQPPSSENAAPAEAYAMLELIEGGDIWPAK